MKTLNQVFGILEKNDFSINQYKENDILCGYELETWTDGGVNEIPFLDFRDEGKDPIDPNDFIKEFERYVSDFNIDESVDMYRQGESYRNNFTISQSLLDFRSYKKRLDKIVRELKQN